jgi:hypothetical protein
MASRKTVSNRKKLIVLVCMAGLVLLLGAGIIYQQRNNNQTGITANSGAENIEGIDLDPPSEAEQQESENNKLEKIENRPTATQDNDSVVINSAYQDQSSKQVVIKTELYGQNWSSCEVTLTKGLSEVKKTADIIYQPTYSSCLGFAINANEFSDGGTWSVILKGIKSDGASLSSSTKEVNIVK